jgi:four helix bundle protein
LLKEQREIKTRELIQFLGIASGSLSELETELELGSMLNYLPANPAILSRVHRVGRLLRALRKSLREKEESS